MGQDGQGVAIRQSEWEDVDVALQPRPLERAEARRCGEGNSDVLEDEVLADRTAVREEWREGRLGDGRWISVVLASCW